MPTWTGDPYTFTATNTYATPITNWHLDQNQTFVTNEQLREEFKKFAESLVRTLKEMQYLNKDISEEEIMNVLFKDEG